MSSCRVCHLPLDPARPKWLVQLGYICNKCLLKGKRDRYHNDSTYRANLLAHQRIPLEQWRIRAAQFLEKRFFAHIEPRGECWEWCGSRDTSGYGLIQFNHRIHKTHRLMYYLARGDIPAGFWVLHKCDNPPCVKPTHLFLGTGKDNSQDREMKGRHIPARGEKVGTAKLTAKDVLEIRRLHYEQGYGKWRLAKMFGVSRRAIQKAWRGENWGWLK